ncbi:hypothetical protein [Thalassospira sp.]|uniref:hypothetical protein n=1 Tax=Thalassospira sp. TaxID=1912094 RepID=UPI001B15595C|nr:hypothetical protein [Thalassospira sp.]MBO6805969.1 hypothetical protein [Thalassospira sp.]
MVPTPHYQGNGLVRIYYSGRDDRNRSHIGWSLVDLKGEPKEVAFSDEPVLAPGKLGCFDDNGVTPSCIIERPDGLYLYYLGWNPGSTVRMHLFGGLAISKDGGETFRRWSEAPILERCRSDPYLNTAPWVIWDNDKWRIYYVSGTEWINKDLPKYLIKTAVSHDGTQWDRKGDVCIDFADKNEVALARPFVIKNGNLYRMWFSHKGESYRMGYAESTDGINWQRDDSGCALATSDHGFDSDMVEYAAIVEFSGREYMFYNGNNYGYDGIGIAVRDVA